MFFYYIYISKEFISNNRIGLLHQNQYIFDEGLFTERERYCPFPIIESQSSELVYHMQVSLHPK